MAEGDDAMRQGPGAAQSGDELDGVWAVIPAGGAGTRLWPLSRSSSPKFLHDLTGAGRSLLQSTWDRLEPLCGAHIMVVTGVLHEMAVRTQLPTLEAANLVAEPSPRDSMAAIGLAAALLERRNPQAIIGSFAADHVIGEDDLFADCVREAVALARADYLVTIGIQPTSPATGFGYIHVGDPLGIAGAPKGLAVRSFVEKPDAVTAQGFLDAGEYHWNAGMFVVRASVLLDLLAEFHPLLAGGLREIAAEPARLAELWPGLTKISIDHAVAEPAAAQGRVAVVPGRFSWDDVGDFASLGSLLSDTLLCDTPMSDSSMADSPMSDSPMSDSPMSDSPMADTSMSDTPNSDTPMSDTSSANKAAASIPGLKILGDVALVLAKDSTGVVIPGSGRTVAVLGLDDVVVVDTPDALLVTTRAHAQDVKALVDLLKASGRADLT